MIVEKAATDANDATAVDFGGPKSGSGNGGDGGDAKDGGLPRGGFPLTDRDITSTTSRLVNLLCLLPVMMKD